MQRDEGLPPGVTPASVEEAREPPADEGTGWRADFTHIHAWILDGSGRVIASQPVGVGPVPKGVREQFLLMAAAPSLLSTLASSYPIRGRILSSPELLDVAARMILAGRGFLGMRGEVADALRGKAEAERAAVKVVGGNGQ